MEKRLICIYFSATDTTRKYVNAFSDALCRPIDMNIDLADDLSREMPEICQQDIVVVASPVYGGRLPYQVASRLSSRRSRHRGRMIRILKYSGASHQNVCGPCIQGLTDV